MGPQWRLMESFSNIVEIQNIRIILTGGTQILLKRIKNTIFADQNFLTKGLNYLLEANIEK